MTTKKKQTDKKGPNTRVGTLPGLVIRGLTSFGKFQPSAEMASILLC